MNKVCFTNWVDSEKDLTDISTDNTCHMVCQRMLYYLGIPIFKCMIYLKSNEGKYMSIVKSCNNMKILFLCEDKETLEGAKRETTRVIVEQVKLLPNLINVIDLIDKI